ncbi:hypothetical protein [Pseudorhodoferax soli]|uniref:Helix-turn-helix protein n=1 Tax=Pseudorhodoferax soli TaxID=545864 RepID=A0A368XDR7_9BURK|nr:hypothetical protein [Pseudorhodoferax soli]RCW65168.1 hypothetical protein DES41_11392 [Pseudorhodoferax soli]
MATTPEVLVLPDGRMDRKNASKYLGNAPKTLAQWAVKGVGPRFIKRGRVWYFKEDLDHWLKAGAATSTAAARAMEAVQ